MKTYRREALLGIPVGLLALAIFSSSLAQTSVEAKYATSGEVESNFRGRSFQLIGDDKVAIVRALDWPKDRSVSLPFWLGTGKATPPALSPKEAQYYVISEAYIVRSLGGNEWLIRAGSSLQKPDAVFITDHTHYKNTGVMLPTVVQYTGTRTMTRTDGSKLDVPVLHEVSLPMVWAKGRPSAKYARFSVKP